MIPLRLQLKNFISYGQQLQTIDFGPYPLICLSGRNGHGKSALLDAITWAVWGQARKVATAVKADNNLLHLGQTQMMVIFDFEFNQQRYRVKREFAQTYGKPYAQLEFGIVDPESQALHPLTDKTIRATQERIQEHLGLDYNAFVNSAFLRQGAANEFSKKSPKERKEILASILSLKQYETIRKTALEKVREGTTELSLNQQLQERLAAELQKKLEISTQLKTVITQLQELQREEKTQAERQANIHKKKKELAASQHQEKLLQYQVEQLRTREQAQQNALREKYAHWKHSQKLLHAVKDKKSLEQEKTTLENKLTEHTKQLQAHLEIKEQLLRAKTDEQQFVTHYQTEQTKVTTQKQLTLQRLRSELQATTQTKSELEKQLQTVEQELQQTTDELKKLREHVADKEKEAAHLQKTQTQFEKRKQFYHKWIAQANQCTTELSQLKQKQTFTHNTDNPSCPLCEQNLSAARKRFLQNKFEQHYHWLTHRLQRFTRLITALKSLLVEQHAQLELLQKRANEQQTVTAQIENLQKIEQKTKNTHTDYTKRLNELTERCAAAATAISAEEKALKKLEKEQQTALLEAPDYQKITKIRQELEHNLTKTIYNPELHTKDKQQLQLLEQQLKEYARMQEESAHAQQIRHTLTELLDELRTLKKNTLKVLDELKQFANLQQLEHSITTEEQELFKEIKSLQERKDTLLQEKGKLENQTTKLETLEKELAEHKKSAALLQTTIDEYQIIATAMSKDGIQALLIENAIPEIEQEANALLGQLTDNQAHIFIESLRDLKKGGTKETLDIVISDSAGIRPYELFSGGEAFRIDFALRIAISKLLARRAGTSLQTLIIDEGFGSQDEEGLSRIMDALYKIQDNFKKIIVVSHLGWMKDQFPVQFAVQKGPNGSVVSMIEQG